MNRRRDASATRQRPDRDWRLATGTFAALLLVAAPIASGTDFLVTTSADSVDAVPGDGLCADADGACSLRAAVQEANKLPSTDRVDVPAGRMRA